jgi:hypothetical protein
MKRQRQIISRIPLRGMSAAQWGVAIQSELLRIWGHALSATERETLQFSQAGFLVLDRVPATALRKLDPIILQQAETLGWRITLAELVRFRMSEWEQAAQGPDLFRRLGVAMAKATRIMQRQELPPITDPDHWLAKRQATEELKLIFGRIRGVFATRRTLPAHEAREEALRLFLSIVSESTSSFPHLAANQDRWSQFFQANPDALRPAALGDRITPAALYDQFLSWATGLQPDALRQIISRLKPRRCV